MSQPLVLVDSHCHLHFPELKDTVDDLLATAQSHDVHYYLTVNTQLCDVDQMLAVSSRFESIFCSVGVHPHEAQEHDRSTLFDQLVHYADHPKIIALGETGLDYYYDHSPRDQQIESFGLHIQAAAKTKLPLIIHTRAADDDTVQTLDRYDSVTGVFHCFSGGRDLAKAALDRGYYLSFSGIITFKKAEELRDVFYYVPIDRILVETDSPYLAPIPHRGKLNQPAWTRFVAEKMAEIKGVPLETIAHHTTSNFFTLFPKARTLSGEKT
jgi:TatD DNase family protein